MRLLLSNVFSIEPRSSSSSACCWSFCFRNVCTCAGQNKVDDDHVLKIGMRESEVLDKKIEQNRKSMAKASQKVRAMAKIQIRVVVGEAPLFQQAF